MGPKTILTSISSQLTIFIYGTPKGKITKVERCDHPQWEDQITDNSDN
jgi:hypothetical protein